jgi:hypothetical protein
MPQFIVRTGIMTYIQRSTLDFEKYSMVVFPGEFSTSKLQRTQANLWSSPCTKMHGICNLVPGTVHFLRAFKMSKQAVD